MDQRSIRFNCIIHKIGIFSRRISTCILKRPKYLLKILVITVKNTLETRHLARLHYRPISSTVRRIHSSRSSSLVIRTRICIRTACKLKNSRRTSRHCRNRNSRDYISWGKRTSIASVPPRMGNLLRIFISLVSRPTSSWPTVVNRRESSQLNFCHLLEALTAS